MENQPYKEIIVQPSRKVDLIIKIRANKKCSLSDLKDLIEKYS